MAENKLEPIHQIFVVGQLAMFERPKTIQKRLKAEFDIEITIAAIMHYNITNKDLLPEWKKLFKTTRKKFLENASQIPIANKNVRVQKLQNMFDRAEDDVQQNTVEMRAILKQAAEEMGEVYTNKREVTGKDGEDLTKPIADAFGQFNKMLNKVYAGENNSPDNTSAGN